MNIDIALPEIFHIETICVYKVWFGDSFYIGSTTNLKQRMKFLSRTIYNCFAGKRVGNNSQTEIMKHLIANPEIKQGIVEILEFVDTEIDLVNAEWKWLNKHYNDFNCLNYTDKTSRKINGVIIRPHAEKIQIRHNSGECN